MRKYLPLSLLGISLVFVFTLLFHFQKIANAAPATHVVISEIQIADSTSSNSADFIELYNPTDSDINLGDMRLAKRTNTGITDTNIIAFTQAHIIPARGYFLWCNTIIAEALSCDASSTGTVAGNNSIILRFDPAETGIIIDAVTIGNPANPVGEGTPLDNPVDGASIERKANSLSTIESMMNGIDALAGNAEDTNNNTADFIQRPVSQPQNSLSGKEPEASSTPTPTLPTTPTAIPTPSITTTPTPTITAIPTATPTLIPTITASPTLTPTPTIKPPISRITFQLVCTETVKTYKILGMEFYITYPTCKVVRG